MTPPAGRARDCWLIAAFAVSAVAMVLPIWIAKYLPLLDLPNHLAAVTVCKRVAKWCVWTTSGLRRRSSWNNLQ